MCILQAKSQYHTQADGRVCFLRMGSVFCTLNTVWNLHLCTFSSSKICCNSWYIYTYFLSHSCICLKWFSSWIVWLMDHNWIANSLPPEWEICLLGFVCMPSLYWFCSLTKKAQSLESKFSFYEYSIISYVLIRSFQTYFISQAFLCMNEFYAFYIWM